MKVTSVMLFLSLLCAAWTPGAKKTTLPGEGIVRFPLGKWECTVINDGVKPMSLAGFFDSASLQRLLPVIKDYHIDTSRSTISLNVLILKNHDHTVVFDPGIGKELGDNTGTLMKHLKIANIDSSKVDFVILSHGHWDHFGGVVKNDGSLNFPNARYVISKNDWDWWTSEKNLQTVPKHWAQWARERLPRIKDKLILLQGNEEIVPGITSIPAFGHTPGHIALLIHSGSENMLYIGDALHSSLQVEVPSAASTKDHDSAIALAARIALLENAYKNKYKLFGFHFEFPGVGLVIKGQHTPWKFQPVNLKE